MKRLVIVSGTMGVGKTTVCRLLYKMAPKSAWLDGDWCWLMHPWNVCEENKAMVMDNIVTLLRSFLMNSTLDNVVFSWVLHRKEAIDGLLGRLSDIEFRLSGFALVCSPDELARRMAIDARDEEQVQASIERLPLYDDIGWEVIDTTFLDAGETAMRIAAVSGMLDVGE